jgi:SH3-like domain-containing protein
MFFRVLSLLLIILTISASASTQKQEIPRFVSIKSNEATLRSGASKNAAVLSIFIKKNEPIEIIAESENWRKIRDFEGEEGWIHSSLLSGKRYVVVSVDKNITSTAETKSTKNNSTQTQDNKNAKDFIELKSDKADTSNTKAKLYNGLRCKLLKIDDQYCKIECNQISGWIKKQFLWGVYDNETKL